MGSTDAITLVELAVIARAILRPHRIPASRIAWVVVISVMPIIGIVIYLLLGETNIGRRRVQRTKDVLARMPALTVESGNESGGLITKIPEQYDHLFRTAHSISDFPTVGGNSARLFSISDETIESMVSDIDGAQDHVHLLFYIWLTDNNGCRVVDTLKRAVHGGQDAPDRTGRWQYAAVKRSAEQQARRSTRRETLGRRSHANSCVGNSYVRNHRRTQVWTTSNYQQPGFKPVTLSRRFGATCTD